MAIQSGGVVLKTPSMTIWQGTPSTWGSLDLVGRSVSYQAMYKGNSTVGAVVDKLARATARLPLKVYQRADRGRPEARNHPYAQLLREPSSSIDPFTFWVWTVSKLNIFGEAFWGKVRDRGGRPVELVPLHPAMMQREVRADGTIRWRFESPFLRVDDIRREDLVHFRFYNPDDLNRGLSPLEALRSPLSNTDAARRAQQAFWRNGGRPSVVLAHPGQLTQAAADRLSMQWSQIHGGADNFGKAAVLEEGMEPKVLSLSAEEAQYIEGLKFDREEVLIRYDVPPPVLHVLDHATFCLPADALVSTERGPVPIVDVVVGDRVWSVVDGEVRSRQVTRSGQTGFKPLLTICTQNRTLRCTDNHPLLVRRAVQINETPYPNRRRYRYEHQWVEAGDLRVGDVIVVAGELPEHGGDESPTRTVSEGFAEFCGLLLADGWISDHVGVTIARASTALYMDHYRDVMRAEFRQRDGEIRLQEQDRMTRFASASAADELAALGLSGDAHTKTVPAWVFGLNPKLRAAFLRGFLDGDGSVDKKGRMSFSSCNPTLLRQIRELCIGLGIPVTNLSHRVGTTTMPNGREASVDQWSFTCSDPGRNRIVGSNDSRYVERLADGTPFGSGYLSTYYRYADRSGRWLEPPIGCGHAKVVRIERSELAVPVYDLTVDGSHNFIAEGVVVHNSNITEQMRSMYRDTMAPHLGSLEATADRQVRTEFADDATYGEFLMDEVLRGDFEQRVNAYQAGINSGWLTPAEVRQLENLPEVAGADQLFVNSTLIPIDVASKRSSDVAPALNPQGPPAESAAALQEAAVRSVMGRLGRLKSVDDIDEDALVAGLNGHGAAVLAAIGAARNAGEDIDGLRRRVRAALTSGDEYGH